MGQLNSNEVPPNPFVHGWSETVASSSPPSPPPLPTASTASPLQQAYGIVSQPLPPAAHATRGSPSSEFPVGFTFMAVLIIALLLGIALASRSCSFSAANEQSAFTNQVPSAFVEDQPATVQPPQVQRVSFRASSLVSSPVSFGFSSSLLSAATQSSPYVPQQAERSQSAIERNTPVRTLGGRPVASGVTARQSGARRDLPLLPDPREFE